MIKARNTTVGVGAEMATSGTVVSNSGITLNFVTPKRTVYVQELQAWIATAVTGSPLVIDLGTIAEPNKWADSILVIPSGSEVGDIITNMAANVQIPPSEDWADRLRISAKAGGSGGAQVMIRFSFE